MDLNTTTGVLNTIPSSIVITPLDNYPTTINFRSKTEAIEQLCLKVFGATPVYESSLEDLKTEEIKKLKSQLTQTHGAVTISRNGYVQELEQQRDRLAEVQNLLEQCLSAMPVGYIPTHTAENLPEMIGDLAKALAEETTERENLERELAAVTEQRDKLAEELKEAQDTIGLMLKDSSCCTIPRYTKENLIIQTGEEL
jgi:chromosome segregation ATPase